MFFLTNLDDATHDGCNRNPRSGRGSGAAWRRGTCGAGGGSGGG
jgi:hypothetical protein